MDSAKSDECHQTQMSSLIPQRRSPITVRHTSSIFRIAEGNKEADRQRIDQNPQLITANTHKWIYHKNLFSEFDKRTDG